MTAATTTRWNCTVQTIHQRIKARREALGLSLEEVAERVGVSWQTIQQWEKSTAPKRTRLEKAAEALKTTVSYLMLGEPQAEKSYSPHALDLASIYDSLSEKMQRVLYAQAQFMQSEGEAVPFGDEPTPAPGQAPQTLAARSLPPQHAGTAQSSSAASKAVPPRPKADAPTDH